jgi:hypothetical protein
MNYLPRLKANLDPLDLSSPSIWDYRREPLVPVYIVNFCLFVFAVQSIEPRASHLLGKHSSLEPRPHSLCFQLIFRIGSCAFCLGQPGPQFSYLCLLCRWDDKFESSYPTYWLRWGSH